MRAIILSAVLLAAPATAMTLQPAATGAGHRAAAVDPDARLAGLAAAASGPTGVTRGKPQRSSRNILKDDPNLRQAFAWLDNK